VSSSATTGHAPVRRLLLPLLLSCAVLVGLTGCGGGGGGNASRSNASETPSESPTTQAQRQKLAKTRFVTNAGLAAGATYQWIVKPYRAGRFHRGAEGRTFALVKAGLAGGFAYNRLKAATANAKGDPLLSKAVAPLTAGIDSLKGLGEKLRTGRASESDIGAFENVINNVKGAGRSAGVEVKDKVPSASQLGG